MAIKTSDQQKLDSLFAEHGGVHGGRREDYFALLYLTTSDATEARLRGTCGTPAGGPIAPDVIGLADPTEAGGWPLAQAGRSEILLFAPSSSSISRVPASAPKSAL